MPASSPTEEPLLAIENLRIGFGRDKKAVTVVDGVSMHVQRGETIGLVGESGSGKTVTGLSILRLLTADARVGGRIAFEGRDLLTLPDSALREIRGRRIGMIFQEPMTALDPVFTIGQQITETLHAHMTLTPKEARERAITALAQVGIPLPERRIDDYPHHLSGGMRQRAMIAIALACEPSLLIADEPTTALDVTIQAQIVDLLLRLVQDRGASMIFISHNLGIVSQACERIVTMYAGQVVEDGRIDDVIERPYHPYTSGLLGSLPRLGKWREKLPSIGGRVPAPGNMPEGCRFKPRCPHARDVCKAPQALAKLPAERIVRCVRSPELVLRGAVS